ncbi:hypothetical protein EVJ58_g767 [Rhodofomes roseus]|uniref:DUF7330 domain-containing protein n=1 Tax=Rhodofomes roseus TaxID=34475 RepID=A0A4Y9Z2L1_9APHY|nr:hypothetical protein EVJ58_g767 [Rhodofomes roseus]
MIIQEYSPSEKHVEAYNHDFTVQNQDEPPPYEEIAGTSSLVLDSTAHATAHVPIPTSGTSIPQFPSPYPATSIQSSSQFPLPEYQSSASSSSRPRIPTAPHLPASVPLFRPPQEKTVNYLSLYSRNDAIVGTYLVDPQLKHANSPGRRDRSVERAHAQNVRDVFGSMPDGEDGNESDDSDKWGWLRRHSTRQPDVNAAFRTRHGNMKVVFSIVESDAALQASTASQNAERKVRGRVMMSSRHGRIDARLTEIHPNRCVDLDVSTCHGNINVFLPSNYDGIVAFRTRRGTSGISFLPAFAARARVLRGNDHEMLVSLSSTTTHMEAFSPQESEDYCIIGTRHGKITIGLHGKDDESAVIQSSGISGLVGALVGTGAKQIGDIVQMGTKASMKLLESTLQASSTTARDTAMQARQVALDHANWARMTATETARLSRMTAAETARLSRMTAAETARLSRMAAAETAA